MSSVRILLIRNYLSLWHNSTFIRNSMFNNWAHFTMRCSYFVYWTILAVRGDSIIMLAWSYRLFPMRNRSINSWFWRYWCILSWSSFWFNLWCSRSSRFIRCGRLTCWSCLLTTIAWISWIAILLIGNMNRCIFSIYRYFFCCNW